MRRNKGYPFRGLVIAATLSALMCMPSVAGPLANPVPLTCKGGLFVGVEEFPADDISGAKCTRELDGKTHCILVADDVDAIQRITITSTGKSGLRCEAGTTYAHPKSLSCLASGKRKADELDFEGIAGNSNVFYATGSWGNKKNSAKTAIPRWVVVRQPLTYSAGIKGNCQKRSYSDLRHIFESHFNRLKEFADKPLQCGGLNIEGLALQNNRLYFGLRSPSHVKAGAAFVLSLPVNALFPNVPGKGQADRHALHFKLKGKTLQGVGIRALERFDRNRLLVVSGPAGVSNKGLKRKGKKNIKKHCVPPSPPLYTNTLYDMPFAIWLWTPKTGRLEHVTTIGGSYKGKKLEGVAVLARSNRATTLLLTFDGVKPQDLSPLATITIPAK